MMSDRTGPASAALGTRERLNFKADERGPRGLVESYSQDTSRVGFEKGIAGNRGVVVPNSEIAYGQSIENLTTRMFFRTGSGLAGKQNAPNCFGALREISCGVGA